MRLGGAGGQAEAGEESFFAKQNTSSSRFLCEVVGSKAGQDR